MRQIRSVFVLVIFAGFLAACGSGDRSVELSSQQEKQVAERIAPVGEVVMAGDVSSVSGSAAGGSEPRSGAEIYQSACFACHGTGAAGAPKMGDAAAWAPRVAQGIETLYTHAINGIRGMPPRGTCMSCSDADIHAAVDHMVENSK